MCVFKKGAEIDDANIFVWLYYMSSYKRISFPNLFTVRKTFITCFRIPSAAVIIEKR